MKKNIGAGQMVDPFGVAINTVFVDAALNPSFQQLINNRAKKELVDIVDNDVDAGSDNGEKQ